MKLFIASSSSNEIPEKYIKDCYDFLSEIFRMENDLVFGAYNEGIMGISYQESLKNQRKIIGVCPERYKDDFKNLKCEEEITTKLVSERTSRMIEEADAIIILPGGIGTLCELFLALESKRCHEFDKPIIIYNSCGYFTTLLAFLEEMYSQKFTNSSVRNIYHIANNALEAIEYIEKYQKADVKARLKEKK